LGWAQEDQGVRRAQDNDPRQMKESREKKGGELEKKKNQFKKKKETTEGIWKCPPQRLQVQQNHGG